MHSHAGTTRSRIPGMLNIFTQAALDTSIAVMRGLTTEDRQSLLLLRGTLGVRLTAHKPLLPQRCKQRAQWQADRGRHVGGRRKSLEAVRRMTDSRPVRGITEWILPTVLSYAQTLWAMLLSRLADGAQ